MAYEILWGRRLAVHTYADDNVEDDEDEDKDDYDDYDDYDGDDDGYGFNGKMVPMTRRPGSDVLIHTYQHDVESLWWLSLWIVMCSVGHKPSSTAAEPVFREIGGPTRQREAAFLLYTAFNAFIGTMMEELKPIGQALQTMRTFLIHHYEIRDPIASDKDEAYGTVLTSHVTFFRDIEQTREVWKDVKISSADPELPPKVVDNASKSVLPSLQIITMPIFALERKGSSKRKSDTCLDEDSTTDLEASSSAQITQESLPGRKASSSKRRKVNRGRGRGV